MNKPKVFFTSDLHFFHEASLRFDNRPWETVEDCVKGMTEKWNNKISKDDKVFILGDMFYTKKMSQVPVRTIIETIKNLNGKKYLIKGNHDKKWIDILGKDTVRCLFEDVMDYHKEAVSVNGKAYNCIMSHYPIIEYEGSKRKNTLMLHGHLHAGRSSKEFEKLKKVIVGNYYNVGAPMRGFEPVTLDEMLELQPVIEPKEDFLFRTLEDDSLLLTLVPEL